MIEGLVDEIENVPAVPRIFPIETFIQQKRPYLYPVSLDPLGGVQIVHCTENPIYVFPEMKLRSLVPSS